MKTIKNLMVTQNAHGFLLFAAGDFAVETTKHNNETSTISVYHWNDNAYIPIAEVEGFAGKDALELNAVCHFTIENLLATDTSRLTPKELEQLATQYITF